MGGVHGFCHVFGVRCAVGESLESAVGGTLRSMEDPVVIEAWLRLTEEARRGVGGAQEAIRLLAEAWKSPEELKVWMERFVPLRSEQSGPEQFREWIEGWWETMGVVPRSRYLDLLENSDTLKARFEEAEATIQQLRTALGSKEDENQRKDMWELWETALHKTLKAQSEWLQTWQTLSARNLNSEERSGTNMEWTKQTELIFKSWTEIQQKMWDDWFKATQGFGKTQATEVWRKTVETWEESLKKTLNAQMEWSRMWAQSFSAGTGVPKEMVEWARQGQEMMRRWAEAQIQLWEGWFGIVKNLDPTILGGNWERESQKVLLIWQEAVKNARDAQVEWGRLWTADQAGKKPKEHTKAQG